MSVHILLWLRYLAFVLLIAIASAPATFAASTDELTPAEAAQVKAMADRVEQQCKTQALAQIKEQAAKSNNPAAPSWVSRLTSGDYCTCIGRRIRVGATPALLRNGTAADGEALVKNSANTCAVENFKTTFPEICRSWSEGVPAAEQARSCACVQRRVDRITGDTLAETIKQTVGDYVRWQHNRDQPLQAGPSSLMSTYMTCFKEAGSVRP